MKKIVISFGPEVSEQEFEKVLDSIINIKNAIKEPEAEEKPELPLDINYYIDKIAKRHNVSAYTIGVVLNLIKEVYPIAFFTTILREIALELDKKYEDHISNSEELYSISVLSGKICKVDKAKIKSYKNFAAFRNIADAKFACKVLRDEIKKLFSDGSKQED